MFGTDGVAMRHKLLQAKWLPCSDGLDVYNWMFVCSE